MTTIPPNGQIATFLNEAPFNGRSSLTGTFTFSSNIPVSVVALRGRINERSEFLLTTLPVTDLSAAPSTAPIVFPHFAAGGGWTTQIVLVNPTDATLTGGLEFRDPSGQVTNPFNSNLTYSIPPRSSFEMQTSLASSPVLTGSVRIIPTGNTSTPAGLTIFSFQNGGVTVSEAGVPAASPGSAFRVFVESFGDFDQAAAGSMRTGLAIANTSPQATSVIVEVKNLDGDTGLIGTLSIPGNGQTVFVLEPNTGHPNAPDAIQGDAAADQLCAHHYRRPPRPIQRKKRLPYHDNSTRRRKRAATSFRTVFPTLRRRGRV